MQVCHNPWSGPRSPAPNAGDSTHQRIDVPAEQTESAAGPGPGLFLGHLCCRGSLFIQRCRQSCTYQYAVLGMFNSISSQQRPVTP